MPITRRDIVSKVFTSVGGGYDADEVDTFLDLVADTLELRDDALSTERKRAVLLSAEIRRLESQVADLRKAFNRTENADAEARELLEQAKLQARMVIAAAREEANKIVQEATEQATLIIDKSRERTDSALPLSDRIAGYALRPVASNGMSAPETPKPAASTVQSTVEPASAEKTDDFPADSPQVVNASDISETHSNEDAASYVDYSKEEITNPFTPEIGDSYSGSDEALDTTRKSEQESDESPILAEEPAVAESDKEGIPILMDTRSEAENEKAEAQSKEDAELPITPAFLKVERPAEFRPKLEIRKPPRPEDIYDESEGLYPSTDWLKDPDSRYE